MTRKKLFDDIKQNPARIYRTPGDVLRDRRFSDAQRLEILTAWQAAAGPPPAGIDILIAQIRVRLEAQDHAAE